MNTFIVHLSSKSINIHINKVIVIFAITPAGLEKKKENKFMLHYFVNRTVTCWLVRKQRGRP